MTKNFDVYFSNRLEILYQSLKASLFGPGNPPMIRRLVVVYGPAMKTWLMLRMAQDPDLNVATGIEFIYLKQAFESLLKISSKETNVHFPSLIELSFVIETELMNAIQNFNNFDEQEKSDWEPLIHYLKLNSSHIGQKLHISRKNEKRLTSLSEHLARLFQDYGRYACQIVAKWELSKSTGWQPRLWQKIFGKKIEWTYPARVLQNVGKPSIPFALHIFSISFISSCEFEFLNRLSEHVPVHYYLLSPCAVFWSDIRSDRENTNLHKYLQRKHKTLLPNLEEFLRDRNPLLANFGRLGREMAHQIEDSQAQTHAMYVLPQHVQELDEEFCVTDDLFFTETEETLSLLHALQADLLMMRNPQGLPPFDLENEKETLQLHIAPNTRRELEILYHNLLSLIDKDPSLCPGDIIVMAPQIGDYVPYIQSIFGNDKSKLDFQILDLGMQTQSEIVQGFLQLLNLSESRWDASDLLQLFEHRSFQARHQFKRNDYLLIKEWVEQAGIYWGDDWHHRNELLQRNHCLQGMAEETTIGTWDYGLSRLLFGMTTAIDSRSSSLLEIAPCGSMDFSQGELLGKWMRLLHALRDDLSPLQDRTKMTVEDWMNYFICLLESYFQPDFENSKSLEEFEDLKKQFDILRHSARFIKETVFPYSSIKSHLLNLLHHRGVTHREEHLQSVRFCSLMPLRSIPAKVIALVGLHEGAFPRITPHSSLNLMLGKENIDYCPLSTDYDRYLFLEAIHSAQEYFLLSYQGYSRYDAKEQQPSLAVEELFSYLEKYYSIKGEKISQCCIFKHPFDSFDKHYFLNENSLPNYSQSDFLAAQTNAKKNKSSIHRFLHDFTCNEKTYVSTESQIDIKNLSAVARNPIKFHLNKILEIYLQTAEDRKLKTEEELVLSPLDRYSLIHSALRDPIEKVIYRAEKEGKLPFGLFKDVAIKRLKEEVEEVHHCLKAHSIHSEEIFQIEFCTSCREPIQLDHERWLLPACSLKLDGGNQISIVGKLPYVTSKGFLSLSKGLLADAWKVWPQFLLYHYAVKIFPQKLEPHLIFVQSSKTKEAFFENSEPYLKQFVNYYFCCNQNFSPLLPEWIALIMEEDSKGLQDKMGKLFSEGFAGYQNHDLRWILNKHCLPSADQMISEWKMHAKVLLGDLIKSWYKVEKQTAET